MAEENPILNNPYEEPHWHYATNLQGELDYSPPVKGRRVFTPEIQTIPVRQGQQGDLMELNEVAAANHGFQVSIVRMHDDQLQQGLLKKVKKAASFVTIGELDIRLT